MAQNNCIVCGSVITGRRIDAKTCSAACHMKRHVAYKKAKRATESKRDHSPRACRHCGTMFSPGYGDYREVFCGAQCSREDAEVVIARVAAWRKANPDAKRVQSHNYRQRKRGQTGTVSVDRVRELYELQRGKCACCGLPLVQDYQVDHIMPLALGGANDDKNLQLLRRACNGRKWAKHPIDFMQSKGFLL